MLIIQNAKDLTTEAQNSLLKTLEEPPTYADIILLSQSRSDVLETIVSRCKRLELSNKQLENNAVNKSENISSNHIENILGMSRGDKFSWALEAGKMDREELIEILSDWVINTRELMLGNAKRDKYLAKVLEDIIKVKKDLEETNINQKLAIETLILHI